MCDNRPVETEAAREIAEKMINLADRHEVDCRDDKCFLIFGLIRDCGYHVKKVLSQGCPKC